MKVRIIGSGSWGTALAKVLSDNNQDVLIYGKSEEEVNDIRYNHKNSKFFGDTLLNENIKATLDINEVSDADVILLGVPSIAIESVLHELNDVLDHNVIVINVAKGFHPITHERLSVLIKRELKDKLLDVVSLIGPSHAEEVVLGKITIINAVSDNLESAKKVQELFSNEYFRVYTNNDVVGAEIAAALKNVMAIASGVLYGLGEGDNARAALITRGLHEMTRFGLNEGGKAETFLGLNGVGDLIVTASSFHSRNFQAGMIIGKDKSAKKFMEENTKTVEGVNTAKVVYEMALEKGIEMPITTEVYNVLFNDKAPEEALSDLMLRPLKNEY